MICAPGLGEVDDEDVSEEEKEIPGSGLAMEGSGGGGGGGCICPLGPSTAVEAELFLALSRFGSVHDAHEKPFEAELGRLPGWSPGCCNETTWLPIYQIVIGNNWSQPTRC